MSSQPSQLTLEQKRPIDLLTGTLAGFVASLLSAILYALYPFLFGMQLSLLAIGVGFFVGFAVSWFGKGKSQLLGIIGALLALTSCIAGDIISVVAIYSFQNKMSFFGILGNLDFSSIVDILSQTTGFISIMFYLMAMVLAYGISMMPPLSSIPQNKDYEDKQINL